MSRDDLVAKARALGVERPELMTRVELGDEIVQRSQPDPNAQRKARGWLGVARDLVASVVESGLNLPDAAAVIRGERGEFEPKGPGPVATVTLAEIYAAQGHTDRARAMVDEVLAGEPDHVAARALHQRLMAQDGRRAAPEKDAEVASVAHEPTPLAGPVDSVEPQTEQSPKRAAAAPAPVAAEAPSTASPPVAQPFRADETALQTLGPPPLATAEPALQKQPTLVLLRGSGPHPILCWDLSTSEAAATLELECIAFVVKNAAAERRRLGYPVAERRGRVVLTELDTRTVVRAALGYHKDEAFVPVAIASEIRVHGEVLDVRYRPPHAEPGAPTPLERDLARDFA